MGFGNPSSPPPDERELLGQAQRALATLARRLESPKASSPHLAAWVEVGLTAVARAGALLPAPQSLPEQQAEMGDFQPTPPPGAMSTFRGS